MERSKSRLHRTYLVLMQLEVRAQPGTLLTTGIDAGASAELIADPQLTSERVVKRVKAADEVQIVSPTLAETEKLLSAPTAQRRVETAETQLQVSQNNINPAAGVVSTTNPTAKSAENWNVGGREMVRAKPNQEAAPQRTLTTAPISSIGRHTYNNYSNDNLGNTTPATNDGSGTRVAPWSRDESKFYHALNPEGGTDRVDVANDVLVSTTAACADFTVTGGQIGRSASIRYYDTTGTLTRALNLPVLPGGGSRSVFNGIAEHPVTGEIFGVGNTFAAPINPYSVPGGTILNTFIVKWPAPGAGCTGGGAPSATLTLDNAPLGGTSTISSLNDIAIEPAAPGGLDVSVVGTDSGGAYDVVAVPHVDSVALGGALLTADFGTATRGLSLDTYDTTSGVVGGCGTGNRHIGADLDNAGAAQPLNFNVVDADAADACDFGWIWNGGTPSAYPDPETGFYGIDQDAAEVFISGGLENSALGTDFQCTATECFDVTVVLNVDAATGGVPTWGWLYGAATGNYTLRRNAAVPGFGGALDDSYTAGSIDNYGLGGANLFTQADTAHYDFSGGIISFQSSGCEDAAETDTDGSGVAYHVSDGDISAAGITNGDSGVWAQTEGACADGSPAQPLKPDIAGTAAISEGDAIRGGTGGQDNGAGDATPQPDLFAGPPSDGFVFRRGV